MGKINNLKVNTSNSARDIYLKNISLGNILGPMTGLSQKYLIIILCMNIFLKRIKII